MICIVALGVGLKCLKSIWTQWEEGSSNVVGIICPPRWDRVNWSLKIWRCHGNPRLQQACICCKLWPKYFRFRFLIRTTFFYQLFYSSPCKKVGNVLLSHWSSYYCLIINKAVRVYTPWMNITGKNWSEQKNPHNFWLSHLYIFVELDNLNSFIFKQLFCERDIGKWKESLFEPVYNYIYRLNNSM